MSKPAPWRPGFAESWRLALRPTLVYFAFNVAGFLALILTVVAYENTSELGRIIGACIAGLVGVAAGQLVALSRVRLWPIFVGGTASIVLGVVVVASAGPSIPEEIGIPLLFFLMAFPCGLLALQHRFELLSLFWPGVGWIGAVMVILNREDRITTWRENKLAAWLPVPLLLLFCFLALMLLFFAAKQSQRVRLWEALSGALARRVETRKDPGARVARRNTLPLLAVLIALFAFTAVLSPYLWRTGKGDRESDRHGMEQKEDDDGDRRGPRFDEEAIRKMLSEMAESAKHNARYLLPLLLLLGLYRPLKRAFVVTHLQTPIFPSSPSERIENLWEYVRIVAEDTGVAPSRADSVEELLARVGKRREVPAEMIAAAAIYARSRYGYAIAPGDGVAMRKAALAAARELARPMTPWDRMRALFRPLR